MTEHYLGAKHNLEQLIDKHVFLICPNNSGSTFLNSALSTSRHTWNLKQEGQHTYGFVGPNTKSSVAPLVWAAYSHWLEVFTDQNRYDWSCSRLSWYFQAFSQSPEATVFVTKSPPFLLNVAQLKQHFSKVSFIFMVRNPYAVVEGISRRKKKNTGIDDENFQIAAQHIITCMQYQRDNIERYKECSVFFSYEKMCAEPERVAQQIQCLVPELDDLILKQQLPVKGRYNEVLRDMNKQQITRLTKEQLKRTNQVFKNHQDLFKYFGYDYIKSIAGYHDA